MSLFFVSILATGLGRHSAVTAADPCELQDSSSGGNELNLEFTESFGSNEHLPTLREERNLSQQISGTVRQVNHTSARSAHTVVLRLWERKFENRFHNKSDFMATEVYFVMHVTPACVAILSLKRGIDREILNIWDPRKPGVTNGTAFIRFHIECQADNASFPSQNYTVVVKIKDQNDNPPVFYNTSTNKPQNFTVSVRQSTPRNTLVFHGAEARDMDEGPNALTRVHAVVRSPFFRLAENTSEIDIFTERQICYENFGMKQSARTTLYIVAEDSSTQKKLTATTAIIVDITEEEDLPPRFQIPGCQSDARMPMHCINPTYSTRAAGGGNAAGGPLTIEPGPIIAEKHDNYQAEKFAIWYSIVEGEGSSDFSIDEKAGNVSQLRPINQSVVLIIKSCSCQQKSNLLIASVAAIAAIAAALLIAVVCLYCRLKRTRQEEERPPYAMATDPIRDQPAVTIPSPGGNNNPTNPKYHDRIESTMIKTYGSLIGESCH